MTEESNPENLAQKGNRWSFGHLLCFRFIFAYLSIYIFPFPISSVPYLGWYLQMGWSQLLYPIMVAFAATFCHMAIKVPDQATGSGDTTINYVEVFMYLVFTAVAAVVWSLIDRKRENHKRLERLIRYWSLLFLASNMLSYGACKLIPSQFSVPSLSRMLETYGESSPMGLLWTFMGASAPYTIFTGAAETISGILLLCPTTVTLGALLSLAVATNIVMLNMSYDVPVKILSTHLLIMSLVILAPEIRRLISFFLLNRPVFPHSDPLFKNKSWNRAALILQIIFGLYTFGLSIYGSYKSVEKYDNVSVKQKFYGIWTATEFSIDGVALPPLITDDDRWRYLIFENDGALIIQKMTGSKQWFKDKLSDNDQVLTLTKWNSKNWKSQFSITQIIPEQISLDGTNDGHQIHAVLDRIDESKLLLKSRGFNWINEYPFNR